MLEPRMTVRWQRRSFDRTYRGHLAGNLRDAGDFLVDRVRDNISTPGYNVVTPSHPRGRVRKIINVRHSKPFKFPFEQTGDLKRSFGASMDRPGLRCVVYSDSPYFLALELGRPAIRLAPRPHLRRTLLQQSNALFAHMTMPLP